MPTNPPVRRGSKRRLRRRVTRRVTLISAFIAVSSVFTAIVVSAPGCNVYDGDVPREDGSEDLREFMQRQWY